MDIVNLKLLGIYYSVQTVLSGNVASPLARDIKSIIGHTKGDFNSLTQRVNNHLIKEVDPGKMNDFLNSLFQEIDHGRIKPERYLGHQFSADQTIEQMEIHDSFMTLYDVFFQQFNEDKSVADLIRSETLANIKQLKIEKNEYWMFKEMLIGKKQRSPISLDLENLCDVVDVMYEAACTHHGPAATDRYLSEAVKESSRLFPAFRSDNFL